MSKKYFLADNPMLFNSLDEIAAYISKMQAQYTDREIDLSTLVVGTYVGKLEKNTSVSIRGDNNRVKKLKLKENPPPAMRAETTVPPAFVHKPQILDPEDEDDEAATAVVTCSFCPKPHVKMMTVQGLDTYMCVEHSKYAKDMLNV
jgi:hypothetical protein